MTDELDKMVETPRGQGRSMTELSPDQPTAPPGTGADWFSPLTPIHPIAPPEVAGRSWDFVPGYNLNTTPRPYEPVTFQALRALADSFDPLRIVIEARKSQMCRLDWQIRVKSDSPRGKRPKKAALSAATRERIADVTDLFKRPSYDVTFRSWLRALLEDLFVLDAPTIYLDRDRRSNLIGLQNMDGATIKRVIDDFGRTPQPFPWSGESFDWCGQIVTPETFAASGFMAMNGLAFPPTHQQILKGLPAVNYTALDLLQRPANIRPGHAYGLSPTESVMMTVSIAMRRALSQLEYYREGNQPEAIYSLPATWSPDQVQRFQNYWDDLYSGNLANRRKLKFMAGDGKYVPIKEPPLKAEIDEWLTRVVCAAFSYPPSAFVTLSNRSIAEQHDRTGEEEGLQSTMQWASDVFNEIIERHLDEDELEFAWAEEDEVDQETQATILTKYLEDGVLSINEVRERLGEEPSPDPAADTYMVRTANGFVPIGGGETDPQNKGTQNE